MEGKNNPARRDCVPLCFTLVSGVMKVFLAPLLALGLLAGLAPAQIQHYPDIKWREKDTDHFMLRGSSTGTDPARQNGEDTWEECREILTGLEDDFTKNEFRTPDGEKGKDEAPFLFTVYLVGDGHTYGEMLTLDQDRYGWSDNQVRSCKITRNYSDPKNRYLVLCKADPENTGGGGERDMTSVFVHSTASTFLKGRARSSKLPFWMSAGFGYYIEHKVTRYCRVHYLDFQEYYNNPDNQAEIVKGAVLGPEDPWPPVLKKMCRRDKRTPLQTVISAEVLTLSPQTSGYIFALTCFLVSTDERAENYRRLVKAAREGKEVTKELLLITYGYEDDEGFEKDWYDFVESSKFK